jgi:hypothetical protein
MIVGPAPNPQKLADNRPLLIQYIRNYPPYLGERKSFQTSFLILTWRLEKYANHVPGDI